MSPSTDADIPPATSSKPVACRGVSRRASEIKPFVVMEVMRAAAELEKTIKSSGDPKSRKVLHLEIGQPSTPPPNQVLTAVASLPSPLGYTGALGLPSLRNAISRHYRSWYDLNVPASQIAVTTGASGAFLAAFATCFDRGDRVAVPIPGYPCYRHTLAALCVEVVPIMVDASTNYQPTCSQLRDALPLAGVVVASPTNPSGSVLREDEISKLARFCGEHSARLIVDEIYHGIGRLPTTAMEHDNVVVVNSFSKYWCMTGFRVGWLATRDAAVMEAAQRCLQNMSICAPSISQHAAVAALEPGCAGVLDAHVARYRRNQETVVRGLAGCGFEMRVPDGAFYVWARCVEACRAVGVADSEKLCATILAECAVAITPGLDFDPVRGGDFVRFSCAGSENDIQEAVERIAEFYRSHATGGAQQM